MTKTAYEYLPRQHVRISDLHRYYKELTDEFSTNEQKNLAFTRLVSNINNDELFAALKDVLKYKSKNLIELYLPAKEIVLFLLSMVRYPGNVAGLPQAMLRNIDLLIEHSQLRACLLDLNSFPGIKSLLLVAIDKIKTDMLALNQAEQNLVYELEVKINEYINLANNANQPLHYPAERLHP